MTAIAAISTFGKRIGRPWSKSSFLSAVAIVLFVCAVAICASTLYLSIKYFHPLFYWDQWDAVRAYRHFLENDYFISDLFAQHNEHRIAFPRLIFIADFALARGLNIINVASIFVVQFLHLLLFAIIIRRVTEGALAVITISIVAILLLSLGQADNFMWGFQVQFVGVYAAATLALWLLALAVERQKRGAPYLGLALCSGAMEIVATYTMSNGVMSGVAMIFVALTLRARPRLAIGAALLTAALLCVYFYHFRSVPQHSPPSYVLHHPFEFAAYTLIYLGGVVRPMGFAALMGGVGWALTALACLRALFQKDRDPARAALTGVMIFIVLTALATAFGRAFFGLDQALSSRYFTPVAVFWSAQVVYLASFVRLNRPRLAVAAAFAAIALAAGGGATDAQFAERGSTRQHYRDLALGSDALLSGVEAREALRLVYPDLDFLMREASFLRERRLSIFSWPEARMRGQALSAVYPTIDGGACLGAFDGAQAEAESDGVGVNGWAWDRRRKTLANRVILVDSHGAIVGFASGGWRRPDVRQAMREVRSREVGWRGFANVRGGEPLRAYAVVDGAAAVCPLPGVRAAPRDDKIGAPPSEGDFSALGAPIEAKTALVGSWTANGQHVSAGAAPVSGPVFGSWSGSDANQGEITIGPFTAPKGAFALPIVTGPSTQGQSIVVKDAETGEVYIRFMPAVRVQWSALVLAVPADKAARPLMLVVADHGSDWGQWIAVGQPRAIVR